MSGWVTGLVILIGWALIQFVLVPVVKVQLKRRESREHIPQPEELWMQGTNTLLYIDAVGPNGVSIIHHNGKNVEQWTDSWPEWKARLEGHVVIFTGKRQPLGPN